MVISWDGEKLRFSEKIRLLKHFCSKGEEVENELKKNISLLVKVIVSILIRQLDVGETAVASQEVQQRSAIEEEQVETG